LAPTIWEEPRVALRAADSNLREVAGHADGAVVNPAGFVNEGLLVEVISGIYVGHNQAGGAGIRGNPGSLGGGGVTPAASVLPFGFDAKGLVN
jgi:hypothetical protein